MFSETYLTAGAYGAVISENGVIYKSIRRKIVIASYRRVFIKNASFGKMIALTVPAINARLKAERSEYPDRYRFYESCNVFHIFLLSRQNVWPGNEIKNERS